MTEQLKPCPFCGNTEPGFERIGTSRQSCIVACGDCGARHESSDEGEASGASWNRRAQPAQAVPPGYVLVPVEPTPEIVAVMAVQEASGSINGTKTIGMAGAVAAYDAMLATAQGEKP